MLKGKKFGLLLLAVVVSAIAWKGAELFTSRHLNGTIEKEVPNIGGKYECLDDLTHFSLRTSEGTFTLGTDVKIPGVDGQNDLENRLGKFVGKKVVLVGREHKIEWDCDPRTQCKNSGCTWLEVLEVEEDNTSQEPR